jgi:hypothetical protein
MLIKRRGKAGLLALNKTWDGPDGAKTWVKDRAGKPVKVGFFLVLSASRNFFFWSISMPQRPIAVCAIALVVMTSGRVLRALIAFITVFSLLSLVLSSIALFLGHLRL